MYNYGATLRALGAPLISCDTRTSKPNKTNYVSSLDILVEKEVVQNVITACASPKDAHLYPELTLASTYAVKVMRPSN